jgi:hypothetical protein
MNDDFESELRNALRRKQPSRDLMPAIPRPARNWWKVAAAAAVVAVVAPIGAAAYKAHEQRKAKDQLVFALRLTAVKLQRTRAQMQTIQMEKFQ